MEKWEWIIKNADVSIQQFVWVNYPTNGRLPSKGLVNKITMQAYFKITNGSIMSIITFSLFLIPNRIVSKYKVNKYLLSSTLYILPLAKVKIKL